MHAGFSACVIFKDAGPPPAKLGSSSFQRSAPNKTDSSRQAKAASGLFSPSVWPDQKKRKLFRLWGLSWSGPVQSDCWRCVFPWFDLNIFTDSLSASSQPPTCPCARRGCAHLFTEAAALCLPQWLCGALRAPWRDTTILFQSGLKGTTKLPCSAALMETQHQLSSLRDQESEYRKAVDYGVHRYAIFSNASITLGCKSEKILLCDTSQKISSAKIGRNWRRLKKMARAGFWCHRCSQTCPTHEKCF